MDIKQVFEVYKGMEEYTSSDEHEGLTVILANNSHGIVPLNGWDPQEIDFTNPSDLEKIAGLPGAFVLDPNNGLVASVSPQFAEGVSLRNDHEYWNQARGASGSEYAASNQNAWVIVAHRRGPGKPGPLVVCKNGKVFTSTLDLETSLGKYSGEILTPQQFVEKSKIDDFISQDIPYSEPTDSQIMNGHDRYPMENFRKAYRQVLKHAHQSDKSVFLLYAPEKIIKRYTSPIGEHAEKLKNGPSVESPEFSELLQNAKDGAIAIDPNTGEVLYLGRFVNDTYASTLDNRLPIEGTKEIAAQSASERCMQTIVYSGRGVNAFKHGKPMKPLPWWERAANYLFQDTEMSPEARMVHHTISQYPV